MNVSDEFLINWADNRYKNWLQSPVIQSRVWGKHGRCYIHTLDSGIVVPHSVTHGTIRIENDDPDEVTGHWCAFAKLSDMLEPTVRVYDPSGIDGEYAAPDQEEFKSQIRAGFPGFTVQVHEPEKSPPQNNDWDTWCNSWSLAWLHPRLRSQVLEVEKTESWIARISTMETIIDTFVQLAPASLREPWTLYVKPNFGRFYEDGFVTTRRILF